MASLISWQSMLQNRFWDGDVMTITVEDIEGSDLIICLRASPDIDWRKGIEYFDRPSRTLVAGVYTQGGERGPYCFAIPAGQAGRAGDILEFGKAKRFGIYTGMYYLSLGAINNGDFTGKHITFRWDQDA